ncbi:MAG: hypothetical protein EZS28_024831 [Streblomastix strix]|uniref:Uncharacterized protein n=1 Tax=Streblomastix strix TaxID=222440 RepID=A0A5J4VAW5_9EUKA|nr:MAG: hypothetical protein EZS28_024831 [Streblomastix strix]
MQDIEEFIFHVDTEDADICPGSGEAFFLPQHETPNNARFRLQDAQNTLNFHPMQHAQPISHEIKQQEPTSAAGFSLQALRSRSGPLSRIQLPSTISLPGQGKDINIYQPIHIAKVDKKDEQKTVIKVNELKSNILPQRATTIAPLKFTMPAVVPFAPSSIQIGAKKELGGAATKGIALKGIDRTPNSQVAIKHTPLTTPIQSTATIPQLPKFTLPEITKNQTHQADVGKININKEASFKPQAFKQKPFPTMKFDPKKKETEERNNKEQQQISSFNNRFEEQIVPNIESNSQIINESSNNKEIQGEKLMIRDDDISVEEDEVEENNAASIARLLDEQELELHHKLDLLEIDLQSAQERLAMISERATVLSAEMCIIDNPITRSEVNALCARLNITI